MESVDDIRMTAQGDILLDASQPGMGVYVGSIDPGNTVVTEAIMDAHIGDNTVDGTAGNTVYDRIFNAKSEAIADAGTATDLKLADYTTTANLDTTVDGYGYLKSADLTGYATESYVDQAETDANTYADNKINDGSNATDKVWSAYKTSTEIGLAQAAAEQHADEAVAELVGSAPALLDTLQELAAALDNDPDAINSLQNIAAGKQNTLTAGANIDITADTISVTGLDSADISDFNTAALAATAAAYDMYGAAATAQEAAEDYADGLAINYDSAGSASAAQTAAETFATNAINDLDTDDIEEGLTNKYFTDSLAKTSAADLLTGASLTNITITGTGAGLTITAENGVAQSTTDDLTEGTNNLYFTDQKAIDALQNTTPTFSAVDINSIAKQVAGTTVVPTAGIATAYSWAKDDYRSAEFLVKVANGDHTEVSKVLVTLHANDNISMTEYGIVGTNGSLGSVTAVVSGNDVQLRVTTVNNTSTLTVVGTLLV
jgi:hypothetical protein